PSEDVVYIALWQRLLERRLGARSDGAPEEALASATDAVGWVETLRRWGRGQLDDQALLRAAQSPVERAEALFYAGMSLRSAASPDGGQKELREVAQS